MEKLNRLKKYKTTLLCLGLLLVAVLTGLYFIDREINKQEPMRFTQEQLEEKVIKIDGIGEKLAPKIALFLSEDVEVCKYVSEGNSNIFITYSIPIVGIWIMLCVIIILIKDHDKSSFYRHEATHKMID